MVAAYVSAWVYPGLSLADVGFEASRHQDEID